jgi:hypothetical protein
MENFDEKRQYRPYLVAFMSFRDEQAYDLQTVFTQEKLAAIRPAEIVRWMCQKAYGNPNPGPDDNPNIETPLFDDRVFQKGTFLLHGEPRYSLECSFERGPQAGKEELHMTRANSPSVGNGS